MPNPVRRVERRFTVVIRRIEIRLRFLFRLFSRFMSLFWFNNHRWVVGDFAEATATGAYLAHLSMVPPTALVVAATITNLTGLFLAAVLRWSIGTRPRRLAAASVAAARTICGVCKITELNGTLYLLSLTSYVYERITALCPRVTCVGTFRVDVEKKREGKLMGR